jgi:hypothetical protein
MNNTVDQANALAGRWAEVAEGCSKQIAMAAVSILAALIISESDDPETLLRNFQSSTEILVIRTCTQKQQRDDATRYKTTPPL